MGQVGVLGGIGIAAGVLGCIGLSFGSGIGATVLKEVPQQKKLEAMASRIGLAIAAYCFFTTATNLIVYPIKFAVGASTAYGMVATRFAIGVLFGGGAVANVALNL